MYFYGIEWEFLVIIVLGIFMLLIVVWFILENIIFREDLLYIIIIYLVLIWIFVASIIFNLNCVSCLNMVIM